MILNLQISFEDEDDLSYQYQYGNNFIQCKKGNKEYKSILLNSSEIIGLKEQIQKQFNNILKREIE